MNNQNPLASAQTEKSQAERHDQAKSRSTGGRIGMLKVSGATEGFHRAKLASPAGAPPNKLNNSELEKDDESDVEFPESLPSVVTYLESGANAIQERPFPPATPASKDTIADAVQRQMIDRPEPSLPKIASTGYHMPPEVLGQESPTQKEATKQPIRAGALASLNSRARKRCKKAIKGTKSQAAAAAAAARVKPLGCDSVDQMLASSMFTLLTYRGMEVIFVSVTPYQVIGLCSRTNLVFQSLDLDSNGSVVSVSSNSQSGMLVVAHEDGVIETFRPVSTACCGPDKGEPTDYSGIPFGRFRWANGRKILAAEIFYQKHETVKFCDRRLALPGNLVDISSSADQKLLVAHRNQLAVFEASPAESSQTTPKGQKTTSTGNATLLWTSVLSSNIVGAKISGDGQALVVVLDRREEDAPIGAYTFIHDMEDGSDPSNRMVAEGNTSIGIVFRPGPFLPHDCPVTRISFRGMGHATSSLREEDKHGNDLLMTYCADDSSVRIFNQNNWQQLMFWVAPPNSRADWIQGSSAFTLGDLESQKKPRNLGPKPPSRRPSAGSTTESLGGDEANGNLRNTRSLGGGAPTTAAGAWIAEVTFRDAFPALRLSRLSYMKRGNDDFQPAHFESVAAILPAGSLAASCVLNSDDMGLAVQGIWPAWNPWLSETTGTENSDALRGSAMQFLGLSSLPPASGAFFGESYLGGTHSPPIELRITASNARVGSVVLMEFPLWGDEDFGAMELGSPIRSVLSLSDAISPATPRRNTTFANSCCQRTISMEYESSRLSAKIEPDCRSISLLWRKPGTMFLHEPGSTHEGLAGRNGIFDTMEPTIPEIWNDVSAVPAPLALPSLQLPEVTDKSSQETINYVCWWPDASYGGPPLLLAVTGAGTILVFEIPPPWCIREPAMPNYDPFNAASSTGSIDGYHDSIVAESMSYDAEDTQAVRQEYDVAITPHPDFGLGLRLESPMDGMPAVAGSFKKHPLNGGMLPAEKTGMIVLGDEVLSVNGVVLENLTFDDIIATVRHVGAEAGPGEPLTLRFRPATNSKNQQNNVMNQDPAQPRSHSDQILLEAEQSSGWKAVMGTSPQNTKKNGHRKKVSDAGSLASLLVGSSAEAQQEFGRLLGKMRSALPKLDNEEFNERALIEPWEHRIGAPDPKELRGAALLVVALENEIVFKRLEVPACVVNEKCRCVHLGKLNFFGSVAEKEHDRPLSPTIRKIVAIDSSRGGTCFAVLDSTGLVRIVVVDIQESGGTSNESEESDTNDLRPFNVLFSHYAVFNLGSDSRNICIRAASPTLLASIEEVKPVTRLRMKIWTARPDPSCRTDAEDVVQDRFIDKDYTEQTVEIEPSDKDATILDFCFLMTGFLDASGSIIVFLDSEAIIYQRRAFATKWLSILRVRYPLLPGSNSTGYCPLSPGKARPQPTTLPVDFYPHLNCAIRSILASYDEANQLVADWHPEALLSQLCTSEEGAAAVLKSKVEKILLWLIDTVEGTDPEVKVYADSPLCVVPFKSTGANALELADRDSSNISYSNIRAGSGFNSPDNNATARIAYLITTLDECIHAETKVDVHGRSQEFLLAMSQRSSIIKDPSSLIGTLDPNELRVLKAIATLVAHPPEYGRLDPPGQLALTMFKIHEALKSSSGGYNHGNSLQQPMSFGKTSHYTVMLKRASSGVPENKNKLPPQSASAGSFAALLSDYQGVLLGCIRKPGKKFDWPTIREARVPFWARSDELLRQISEEIGQNLYRESRDILKSAIFFIIAGKKRTLTNLSAADRSESGKKFFKFLTSFDFSSERGRSAAEKNAFSLLRKNQYSSAAAFFLLAEPPGLKSAVETIASKMEDLDLAFLVARLVGSDTTSLSASPGGFGSSSGSMLGFSGTLGGGGGYAGSGSIESNMTTRDSEGYVKWNPQLGKGAVELIRDRGLPASRNDPCFSALLLIWLGRCDEASHWLSGFIGSPDGLIPRFLEDVTLPFLKGNSTVSKKSMDPVVSQSNLFLNFVSSPFLLRSMSASPRTIFASSLLVSESLRKRGIELPAILTILQNNGQFESERTRGGSKRSLGATTASAWGIESDDKVHNQTFPNLPQGQASLSSSTDAAATGDPCAQTSSIFDSFDAPATRTKSQVRDQSFSIFDRFDSALSPSQPKNQPTVPTESKPLSIFDSFDVPIQRRRKEKNTPPSIFDNFGSSPNPPKDPSNSMDETNFSSSIFDSYDTPRTGVRSIPVRSERTKHNKVEIGPVTTPMRSTPDIWTEWQKHLLLCSSAQRLIRELASICARFNGQTFEPALYAQGKPVPHRISGNVSRVLQFHCEGESLVQEVRDCIDDIGAYCTLDATNVVHQALRLLGGPHHIRRVCLAVLLRLSLNEIDQAEDIVRNTAHSLINMCSSISFSSHRITCNEDCVALVSSSRLRISAVELSWQLELCLWMHRGGALPLSGNVLNESICAIRIGMLVASWNQDLECIETLIQQPPDCLMNHSVGRQLWSSLKLVSSSVSVDKKHNGASSGGWEFLVDCRRAEATELLRPRPTGCFIIRPHPDDHGVFTLSFKTNLVPASDGQSSSNQEPGLSSVSTAKAKPSPNSAKTIKRDDVVQHAIIRLSDSGFRCGSFGPFATLMKLLEAVSSSLPFDLRFDQPPTEGVIKEEGSKPSPNSAFFRKLGLNQVRHAVACPPLGVEDDVVGIMRSSGGGSDHGPMLSQKSDEKARSMHGRREKLGYFFELLVLSEVRKQLSSVAAAKYDVYLSSTPDDEANSVGSVSDRSAEISAEQEFVAAARMLRPLLAWCQTMEIGIVDDLAPLLHEVSPSAAVLPVALNASETAIEISTTEASSGVDGGDAVIRRMIQPGSGVEFRTLRLGDANESAMVVLFSKKEAVGWFLNNCVEKTEEDALERLRMMEDSRVIEPVDAKVLAPKSFRKGAKGDEERIQGSVESAQKAIRYRLVDPWEVEPLGSREAETRGASLGRHRFLAFSLSNIAAACEDVLRSIGGLHLLEFWAKARGGVLLTKAIATVHPPWERAAGGDLQLRDGIVSEPAPYINSIRQHLYRNALFRRLGLPQRFVALIQVELLDLKNLTSPGGSLSLTVYSLLRLKRSRSTAPLTVKARTLDSAATTPMKLGKSTGPNAPASWGTLVRFRFPLPEYTAADGKSYDGDREALFKGPPSVLQVTVYEKKFMSDSLLGGADVKLDGLVSGGQLEEWVPLRTEANGINWFARMRLTLRFELMCLSGGTEHRDSNEGNDAPSVGLRRIKQLSSIGGAQEDLKKSASTPDLLSYFESMVY